ncbi:MAG: alpha/beta hydrolase, partial [Bacteroidota bacterium]
QARLAKEIQEIIAMLSQASPTLFRALSQAMMDRSDQRAFLAQTSLPLLFLHGAHDQVIPPTATFLSQRSLLKEDTFYIIPQTGHILMIEAPKICGAYLKIFFSKCTRK